MKREKEQREESVRERVCRTLDIQPDLLPGASLIEVRGQHAMTVSGCGKILIYTPEEIRIELRRGSLSVCGARLSCTSYHAGSVGIDGKICRISFEEA